MLAKGRLLGIQFQELLEGGENCLYFTLAKHADKQAMRIRRTFEAKGIELWNNSVTNMQFPLLTKAQQETLGKKFVFEYWGKYDDERDIVRFCTSWATRTESVDALCNAIEKL